MNAHALENWLRDWLAQTLKIEPSAIDRDAAFTNQGVDSLGLYTLTGDLAHWLGHDLPVSLVWEYTTIGALVDFLAKSASEPAEESITIAPRDRPLIASHGQERLWRYAHRFADRNMILRRFVLSGPLNVRALEEALDEFVRRHKILRTTFSERDGVVTQQVHRAVPGNLTFLDLTGRPDAAEQAARAMRELAARGFNLEEGPLLRVLLVRHGESEWTIGFILHHLTYDAHSLEVLDVEMSALYDARVRGDTSPLAEPPLQMADFAAWHRHWLRRDGEAWSRQLAWWKNHWSEVPAPFRLPFTLTRPQSWTELPPCFHERVFPQRLFDDMKNFCREENVTLYVLIFSAFASVLGELTEARSLVIGTYVSERHHAGLQDAMGFFINLLALRIDFIGAEDFGARLHRLSATIRDATLHQELPFEELARELRETGRNVPEVQVIFQHVKTEEGALRLTGLTVEDCRENLRPLNQPWGLTLSMVEGADSLKARLRFDPAIYEFAGAVGMVQRLEALLAEVVAVENKVAAPTGFEPVHRP